MPLLGTIGEASSRAFGLYGGRPKIALTIAANTYNYDVYTNRGPSYIAGASDITVTVNPGITVGSTATPTYAMLVPSAFNPGDTITIVNNGLIQARGGNGGPGAGPGGSVPGSTGGSALYVNRPTTVTNNGTIAGGGGGGGGGSYGFSGPAKSPTLNSGGGGGGGAGFDGGTGGSAGIGSGGSSGSPGTSPAGGGGGGSGGPTSTPGGAGGGRGAAGSAAPPGGNTGPGGGGGAGNYIVGNPFVTWPATGTRQGGVA